MSTRAESDAGELLTSRVSSSRLLFASIWMYALASGLLAYGLTEVVAAVTVQSSLRLSLQLGTIPVSAIAVGLTCERTLGTVYVFIAGRRRN